MQTNQKYELRGGGQQANMSIMAAERWMRATTLTSLRSAEQRHIFRLDADLTKKKRKKERSTYLRQRSLECALTDCDPIFIKSLHKSHGGKCDRSELVSEIQSLCESMNE